jgi:hypothetical protein
MAKIRKLVLTISDHEAVQAINWDKLTSTEFSLIVVIGELNDIKVVSKSVLVLEFETGELRLDIDLNNLNKLKNVE